MELMQKEGKHEAVWITISSDEYDSMRATLEVLSDPDLMRQIRESGQAIKEGKVRSWNEFMKEMGCKQD